MPLMPLATARVFDPVLRDLSIGYSNGEAIWNMIAPAVPVTTLGGQLISFDKSTRSKKDFTRAPGTGYKTVHRSYSSESYSLDLKGAEFPVPEEHAQDSMETIGLEWDRIATESIMEELTLELEAEVAGLVTNANNYPSTNKTTLSGSDQLSDPTSNIYEIIDSGMSAVQRVTGKRPNVFWAGSEPWDKIRRHPSLVDTYKHVQKGLLTTELVAEAFQVAKVIVGTMTDASSGTDTYLWGKSAGFAYVNPRALNTGSMPLALNGDINRYDPSFMYTYVQRNHPFPKPVQWNEEKDTWFYRTKFNREPKITAIESGYLFSNAIA